MPNPTVIEWKYLDPAHRRWLMRETLDRLTSEEPAAQKEGRELLGSITNIYAKRWVNSRVARRTAVNRAKEGRVWASQYWNVVALFFGGTKAITNPNHIAPQQQAGVPFA